MDSNDRVGWMDRAACRDADPAAMFPTDNDDGGIAAAKDTCQGCPVLGQCLGYALDLGERWGVWGGLTYDERKAVRRRERRAVSAAVSRACEPVRATGSAVLVKFDTRKHFA